MKTSRITVELPDQREALIDLPAPVTLDLLSAFEQSMARTLARLRRSLSVDAIDPGLLEYASWLPAGRH